MPEIHKTVFISYRRKPAAYIARAIRQDLIAHGYDVFMDVEDLEAGKFKEIIENQVKARAHLLVILTAGTVSKFDNPNDMMRHEIEYAMEYGRNIIPLRIDNFQFNRNTMRFLTSKLAALPDLQAVLIHHEYFESAMERLHGTNYLGKPVDLVIHAVPASELAEVERKLAEIPAEPVTETELSAEAYFAMGLEKQEAGDLEGAIADYTHALEINPMYIEAYNNRGNTRQTSGDLYGAIADHTEAMRLNPQFSYAYNNRGIARADSGDLEGALTDYTEAIRLNPQFSYAYNNRGAAHADSGDLENALADYTTAVHLNPEYAEAHNNRGIVHYHKGDLQSAIIDCTEAIRLNLKYPKAYHNRGEIYFALGDFEAALSDFQQADVLRPSYNMSLGGLAITQFMRKNTGDAKSIWRGLVDQDEHYLNADWVGLEFGWRPELVDAARKLIATL